MILLDEHITCVKIDSPYYFVKMIIKHWTLFIIENLTGDSGLCTETSLVAPNFGADVISGCQLRLPFSWFDDCVALRTLVENEQTQLISTAGFISRFGNPTLTAGSSDWLPINARYTPFVTFFFFLILNWILRLLVLLLFVVLVNTKNVILFGTE